MEPTYRVRILIVDDKPDKAKALEAIVADLGDVVCVHSGKDALRCLMSQSFAVILLDVNMPIMDGFETAELIRKRETSERTPIIFVTSYYDADTHRTRAYTLGAVDYILAPVIPEVLKAKVSVFADLFTKTEEVKLRAEERVQLMQEQMARVAAEAARAAAEDGERRAAFLSNASRLLASSLDYEATLERVAQLTVPELCDWCAVNIVKEDGQLQCLAIARGGQSMACDTGTVYEQALSKAHDPVRLVIESGKSELLNNANLLSRTEAVAMKSHLAAMGLANVQSYMIVPLKARARTLGALTFVTCTSQRLLTQRDMTLAEDLGERAAIAIDNARLYKDAQMANRMKDEFLTVVSHELRTPLTPIVGWTRMLRSEKLSPQERSRALEVIERNAKMQAKLIEELLDVSRIITGKFRLSIGQVDLAALVAASVDSLRPAADAKRIRIELQSALEPCMLTGDGQRLQQVMWNLLSNAIKFTPESGSVSVSITHHEKHLAVEVRDTGKGIDADFLPFVFERFRQADSTTTRAYGGLGIGLAIVRHLVELHGGTVQVVSDGEDKGSAFTIMLPSKKAGKDVGSKEISGYQTRLETTSLSVDFLKGKRILITENEPDTRDLLTVFFERHGSIVIEAASAHEALEHLERSSFDLLLSDIGMSGTDGYALARSIRNLMNANSKIPAIALTAYAREDDVKAALTAGYQEHITKPIDLDLLLRTIERALSFKAR